MNISFTFKNFEPSDHLRKYAKRRFEKLARFVAKAENAEMKINLSVDKFRHKAEVQFAGDNMNFSAVEQSEDMYSSVDLVLDKIEAQLKKHAEKIKEKRHQGPAKDFALEIFKYTTRGSGRDTVIEGSDNFDPKPLYPEEAAMVLDQRNDYEFLVFLNAEYERVNVIYRRKNGGFGLIDPGI